MFELRVARGRGRRTEIISTSGPKPNPQSVAALCRRAKANVRAEERQVSLRARRCVLIGLLSAALIALGPAGELAAASKKHVSADKSTKAAAKNSKRGSTPNKERKAAQHRGGAQTVEERIPLPRERPSTEQAVATEPAAKALPPTFDALKQAIGLVRKGNSSEASALATSIGDPVAQKLVEWALLRSENGVGFERHATFIRANPDWPSIPLLRRRAEARLWQDRRDAATVRRFLDGEPTSARGRLALARVLMGEGDRAGAEREIRVAWQSAELSA